VAELSAVPDINVEYATQCELSRPTPGIREDLWNAVALLTAHQRPHLGGATPSRITR
jgi:hypothetical protein